MGANPKITEGIVSSLSGILDDPRTYQISVPVQSGNSGGPLLNRNGEAIGVVTAKLDAETVFEWTGDLPENVNYAIKIDYLRPLLYSLAPRRHPLRELQPQTASLEELAARIQGSIVMVVAQF